MDNGKPTSLTPDPGLAALVMLLRFQGLGVELEQIRHQFGATPIGIPEMLRCAKGFGLKARSLTTKWARVTPENAAGEDTSLVVRFPDLGPIAHQTAGSGEFPKLERRGNRIASRQSNDLIKAVGK